MPARNKDDSGFSAIGDFEKGLSYHVGGVEKGGDAKLLFSKAENELAVPGIISN